MGPQERWDRSCVGVVPNAVEPRDSTQTEIAFAEAVLQLRNVAHRVSRVRGRLVGHEPVEGGTGAQRPPVECLSDLLRNVLTDLNSVAADIESDLDAIEKRLLS